MVISRNVPDLEGIGVLLGSEPAMDAHHVFYQRLVAKDGDEAREIVESFLKAHSRTELFEQLFIPTLISYRHDHDLDRVDDEDGEFILRAVRQFVEEGQNSGVTKTILTADGTESTGEMQASLFPQPLILGCPANDEADELALLMLSELLPAKEWRLRVLSPEMLSSERISEIEATQPALVCIGCLPGRTLFPVRQFCKKFRARFPNLPILVGRWSYREREKNQQQLSLLVTAISWTLDETRNQVVQFGKLCPDASTIPRERPGSSQRQDNRATPNECLVLSEQM